MLVALISERRMSFVSQGSRVLNRTIRSDGLHMLSAAAIVTPTCTVLDVKESRMITKLGIPGCLHHD